MTASSRLGELLRAYVAARGLKLKHLAAGVVELSKMFTGRAPMDPDYMRRPGLRHAYACYYAPRGAMKLAAVLAEADVRVGRVVDLGGGPGTGLLGLAIAGLRPDAYTLVDRVAECADEAPFWFEGVPVRFERRAPPSDLGLVMNLLGEPAPPPLPPARTVIVIEPALKVNTQALMARRDAWAAGGWRVLAPCPAVAACPMRAHPDLWCHVEIGCPTVPVMDELGRRAGLRPESLKFSYMVLSRDGGPPPGARLVSNVHKEKGKVWGWVCGAGPALVRAELLRRNRSEETREFINARRGSWLDPLELDERGRITRVKRRRGAAR